MKDQFTNLQHIMNLPLYVQKKYKKGTEIQFIVLQLSHTFCCKFHESKTFMVAFKWPKLFVHFTTAIHSNSLKAVNETYLLHTFIYSSHSKELLKTFYKSGTELQKWYAIFSSSQSVWGVSEIKLQSLKSNFDLSAVILSIIHAVKKLDY